MIRRALWILASLLLSTICNSVEIAEEEEVSGLIPVGQSVTFELTTIVDWKYLTFTATVSMLLLSLGLIYRESGEEETNVAAMQMHCSELSKQV